MWNRWSFSICNNSSELELEPRATPYLLIGESQVQTTPWSLSTPTPAFRECLVSTWVSRAETKHSFLFTYFWLWTWQHILLFPCVVYCILPFELQFFKQLVQLFDLCPMNRIILLMGASQALPLLSGFHFSSLWPRSTLLHSGCLSRLRQVLNPARSE